MEIARCKMAIDKLLYLGESPRKAGIAERPTIEKRNAPRPRHPLVYSLINAFS